MRLRQPRVIGEILAGLVLGPSVLGRFAPHISDKLFGAVNAQHSSHGTVLQFIYWMGLLLLMFASGNETRRLFARQDRRETAWLTAFGTVLPFVIFLVASPWLPLDGMMGTAQSRTALVLVIGIAVAVTSIPVISRIFYDLKILHTRFASLVLGVAVLEDIALWGVLAVATALAASGALPQAQIVKHVGAAVIYFAIGLTLAPWVLKRLHESRWNVLASASPAGYAIGVLFTYTAVAAVFDISLVFAAFLAGFALRTEAVHLNEALESISRFAFGVFIPIYFAVVGYKLDLSKSLSLTLLVALLAAACLIKLISVLTGAKLAGFGNLDAINLAVAFNARGGPGIVLASVAYDARIINAAMYTTLVLLAVVTSQAAGAWLDFVLRRGWPLLTGDVKPVLVAPGVAPEPVTSEGELAA
jgi:K+:H+ antiporter